MELKRNPHELLRDVRELYLSTLVIAWLGEAISVEDFFEVGCEVPSALANEI